LFFEAHVWAGWLAGWPADAHNIWKSKVKEIWDNGLLWMHPTSLEIRSDSRLARSRRKFEEANGQLICLSYFTSPFRVETHSLVEHVLHHICVCNEPQGSSPGRGFGATPI
jgi:hypothetical protein